MGNLRSDVIRLAGENPALRPHLLPILKKAAMSEDEFWRTIEPYGWGTRTTDYKKIQKDLMSRFTAEEAESLSEAFRAVKSRLDKVLTKLVKGVSDDSYDDLLAHIIGMGKKEYDAVMKNPALAQERIDRRDYKESFAYSLPHKQDYGSLDVAKYVTWAAKVIPEYEGLVAEWKEVGLVPDKKLKSAIDTVVKALKEFVKTKDHKKFLETEKSVRDAVGVVTKATQGNPWAVFNMYTDIKQYLLP